MALSRRSKAVKSGSNVRGILRSLFFFLFRIWFSLLFALGKNYKNVSCDRNTRILSPYLTFSGYDSGVVCSYHIRAMPGRIRSWDECCSLEGTGLSASPRTVEKHGNKEHGLGRNKSGKQTPSMIVEVSLQPFFPSSHVRLFVVSPAPQSRPRAIATPLAEPEIVSQETIVGQLELDYK